MAHASSAFLLDFERNWFYGDAVDKQYAAKGVTFTNVLGVAMVQPDGMVNTSVFMNVDGGADNALTFFYASPSDVLGTVKAYSGLNGSGTLLCTLACRSTPVSTWSAWTTSLPCQSLAPAP